MNPKGPATYSWQLWYLIVTPVSGKDQRTEREISCGGLDLSSISLTSPIQLFKTHPTMKIGFVTESYGA